MNAPSEITWRLDITTPQPGGQFVLEATLGNWAHLHHTTPPAFEPDPKAGYGGKPGYTVTVPGERDAPPGWLRSLHNYLWGCGYFARITNDAGYYTDAEGRRWRKHDGQSAVIREG